MIFVFKSVKSGYNRLLCYNLYSKLIKFINIKLVRSLSLHNSL